MDTSRKVTVYDLVAASDAELERLATRHALALFREFRRTLLREFRYSYSDDGRDLVEKATARLKALLDTRGHVVKPGESKRLRKLAAKAKT